MMLELPTWLPITQIVANITTAIAGLCVSVASLVFGYQNNFGRKPLGFVLSHGVSGTGKDDLIHATLHFEVWNRRKYPIALRGMAIRYPSYLLTETQRHPWQTIEPQELYQPLEEQLAPTTHKEFSTTVTHDRSKRQKSKNPMAIVKIYYFDPRTNKASTITIKQSLLLRFGAETKWWKFWQWFS